MIPIDTNNDEIFSEYWSSGDKLPTHNAFFSQQYFLFQAHDTIIVLEIGIPFYGTNFWFDYIVGKQNFKIQWRGLTNFIYLDPLTSNLFVFSDKIQIQSFRIPQLQIKSNMLKSDKFQLYATQSLIYINLCSLEIEFTIISPEDKKIIINYNVSNIFFNAILTIPFYYQTSNVAGPLINPTGNILDSQVGTFTQATLEYISTNFNQQFLITQMFNVSSILHHQNLESGRNETQNILFVGANTQGIFFYLCAYVFNCSQIYEDPNVSFITAIEISYNYQGFYLVGASQGQEVILYNISQTISKETLTFPQYKQFFLMFDGILLLLFQNQIFIQSLTSKENITIDEEFINNLFSTQIQFNPMNIAMNSAYQSSLLYINNNYSFIILGIQSIQIIPFSFVEVNYSIYQLNIINYQLIASFQCEQSMCFGVWNIQNLLNPYYLNDLPSVNLEKNVSIQSDNLFMYVMYSNSTILVFNPILSYHSSLYFSFEINGNQFSTQSVDSYSIISYSNTIQILSAIILQKFQSNINTQFITQTYFRFTMNNIFQGYNQTQNRILTLINPSTSKISDVILNQSFTQHENVVIDLSKAMQQQDYVQIQNYSIAGLEGTEKAKNILKNCQLQNFIELMQNGESIQWLNTSSLIILNNTLLLQDGLNFLPINVIIEDNQILYAYIYQSEIQASFNHNQQCNTTFIYNQYLVSQVCIYEQQWYLFQFEFTCFNFDNCSQYNQTLLKLDVSGGVEFQMILKLITINQSFQLILANYKKMLPQIYLVNTTQNGCSLSNLQIQCDTGIVDFIYFQSSGTYFMPYICQNKMFFYIFFLNNSFFDPMGQLEVLDLHTFISPSYSLLISINLLLNYQDQQIILLTTNNAVSFILTTEISLILTEIGYYWNVQVQNLIKTIPPYGNNLQQSWNFNGLIVIDYQFQDKNVYAIYDWMTMNDSINSPLIMKGGFESVNSQSIAFNVTSSEGGYIYQLINGKLYGQIVSSSAFLNCTFKSKGYEEIILAANNQFSQSSILVKFFYSPQKDWVIGLMVFVAIVMSVAIIFYWYKTKDVKEGPLLEELELEQD